MGLFMIDGCFHTQSTQLRDRKNLWAAFLDMHLYMRDNALRERRGM